MCYIDKIFKFRQKIWQKCFCVLYLNKTYWLLEGDLEEIVKDFHKYLLKQKCKDFAVFNVKIDGQKVNCILVSLPTTLENKKFADKIMVEFGIENFPEGYAKGEWIVYDFGNIILNSFIPSIREKFNLEKLWQKEKIENIIKEVTYPKKKIVKVKDKEIKSKA